MICIFLLVLPQAWLVDVETVGGGVEEKVLVCDSTGEDPSCHNSACYLGLCTRCGVTWLLGWHCWLALSLSPLSPRCQNSWVWLRLCCSAI